MKAPGFCPYCGSGLQPAIRDQQQRLVCSAGDCNYVYWNNPTPVVAAIVEDGDDVILVRNIGWPENWFGLVTGFLEQGEHPDAAVLREVHEELGLHGELVSRVGLYSFEQMNQLIIAYHVRASGTVQLCEQELADYRRVPTAKLKPWPFATGDAVRDWLASR